MKNESKNEKTFDAMMEVSRLKGWMEANKQIQLEANLEEAKRLQRLLENKKYRLVPECESLSKLGNYLGISRQAIQKNAERITALEKTLDEQMEKMRVR